MGHTSPRHPHRPKPGTPRPIPRPHPSRHHSSHTPQPRRHTNSPNPRSHLPTRQTLGPTHQRRRHPHPTRTTMRRPHRPRSPQLPLLLGRHQSRHPTRTTARQTPHRNGANTMTIQTLPVGATTHHTEATLKARYEEALVVLDAWRVRARLSGGTDRKVAELGVADAEAWVLVARADYREALGRSSVRAVGLRGGRGGVSGRLGSC